MNRIGCLILSFLFISMGAYPQEKRLALVIGNSEYQHGGALANPVNDARAMTGVLQQLGFTVYPYENLNQGQLKKAIDDFGMKLKGNDVGLFYYAGHGIQAKGFNYLIPVDAQLQTEEQVDYDCVRADRILALMETSGTKVNVIILDACRNNPFERSWTRSATGRGLAFMNAPSGTLIAYATAPGSTASDGTGTNGLYTSAILESIAIPNLTILQMFQNVRSIVSQKSGKQQVPWESTSLTGDFYFNKAGIVLTENQSIKNENVTKMPMESEYAINNLSDIENRQYKTIKIGNQVWMAENLSTTKLNDGTPIPLVTDNDTWGNLTTPGYCFYNNKTQNGDMYGALYNWYAVNTGKLCPEGWHVPSDDEWTTLTMYLGGESVSGSKLKETGTTHWIGSNTGSTNETSFTALPGGYRLFNISFYYSGRKGIWWSASEEDISYAWLRSMNVSSSNVVRNYSSKENGLSVRCIKD